MRQRGSYIYIISLLLLAMVSCSDARIDAPDGGDGTDAQGDGMISIVLFTDKTAAKMRADEPTLLNLIQEKRINNARLILYDMDGKASYVRDYDPSDISQWVSSQYPVYQTKAFKVKKQKYRLAVLINFDNIGKYLLPDRDQSAMDIEYRTRMPGHDMSALTDTPLDFSVQAGIGSDYDKAKTLLMQTLIGAFDTPPSYASEDFITDMYGFFMCNADGLTDIDLSDIKDSGSDGGTADSEQDPVTVYVERAVAKVALFASENLTLAEPLRFAYVKSEEPEPRPTAFIDPDSVLIAAWRTDMINMKTYPMRKPSPIAPVPYGAGPGGSLETPLSSRLDRYAEDPNHTTAPGDMTGELFRLPGDIKDPLYTLIDAEDKSHAEPDYIGLPLKIASDHLNEEDIVPGDGRTYDHFEYVPENTLSAASYHTAAATHILLRIRIDIRTFWAYSEPIGGVSTPVDETSGNYIVYNNKAYPVDELYLLIADLDMMESLLRAKHYDPDSYDPETKRWERLDVSELKNAPFTQTQIDAMLENMTNKGEANMSKHIGVVEAKEIAGVKFYKDGVNYFRIPIRHFDDTQSPDAAGYGRYGVVRNNTYVVRLDAITGPGSNVFPGSGEIVRRSRSAAAASAGTADGQNSYTCGAVEVSVKKTPGTD